MKFKELLREFKALDSKKRIAIYIMCAAAFLFSAYTSGLFRSLLRLDLTANIPKCIARGLFTWPGILVTVIIFAVILMFAYFIVIKKDNVNASGNMDNDSGVTFMKKGTYGTSRWMLPAEARDQFSVGKCDDITETIYGRLMDGSGDVVSRKPDEPGNKNHLILGTSGSGKSYCFVRTELLQAVKRNESFVVTDPKGELYLSLAGYCESIGYNVKKLNLVDPEHSDTWNCVKEVLNPETGRLDGNRLQSFADIYIQNTSGVGTQQEFWTNGALNLLKAYIGTAAWERESWIVNAVMRHIDKIIPESERNSDEYQKISYEFSDKLIPLTKAYRLLANAAYTHGMDRSDICRMIENIEAHAPEFSIGKVLNDVIYHDGNMAGKVGGMPKMYPARIAYEIFAGDPSVSEQVRASTKQGVKIRLQILQAADVRKILSNDGIVISDTNKKQTAYFLIISDKDLTLRSISSLFFSFLFKDTEETFDKKKSEAEAEGREFNGMLPVTVMMDEAYSVGRIPNFATFMSTCRSRNLYVHVILQTYSQLEELYEENGAGAVVACCDTIYFLGCNDPKTAEFISSFVSGEATVMTQSRTETRWSSNLGMNGLNVSEGRRYVLTPAEARSFSKYVLVSDRKKLPLKLEKFPYTEHRIAKNGLLKENQKSAFMGATLSERSDIRDSLEDEDESHDSSENVYIEADGDSVDGWITVHRDRNSGRCFVAYDELKKMAADRLTSPKDRLKFTAGGRDAYIDIDGRLIIPSPGKKIPGRLTVRVCRSRALENAPDQEMTYQEIRYAAEVSQARGQDELLVADLAWLDEVIKRSGLRAEDSEDGPDDILHAAEDNGSSPSENGSDGMPQGQPESMENSPKGSGNKPENDEEPPLSVADLEPDKSEPVSSTGHFVAENRPSRKPRGRNSGPMPNRGRLGDD